MSKSTEFNQKLIDTIVTTYPKKNDQLNMLMELIFLGKEAAYRRLRGDVPFSFAEACIVAEHMGISLDQIVHGLKSESSMFELRIPAEDVIEYHEQVLTKHIELFEKLVLDPTVAIHSAYNIIPHSMFLLYENLSKLRTLKWRYQFENGVAPIKLSEINIPDHLFKIQRELAHTINKINECTLIFDRYIFSSFIKEIQYFYHLELISNDERDTIKIELNQLINDLELTAIQGKNRDGGHVWMFLSNIEFDLEYVYIHGKNMEAAYMDIYLMNSLVSTDPKVCKMQKRWIDSLRKYSTLISVSGERERKIFFDKQRELIDTLL